LAKHGLAEADVLAAAKKLYGGEGAPPAPSSIDLKKVILERMLEIEPAARQGAMVYVPELSRAVDFQQGQQGEFQQAVWELVRQERIALHRHGHPANLSPEERGSLITDEQGNYYHGISMRTA
jgi:hypothetical protein